jgi:hypothetical protein
MSLIARFIQGIIPIGLIAGIGLASFSAFGQADQSRIKGFGINLVGRMPTSSENSENALVNIQSSGASYVRIELNWSEIEYTQDTYNWSAVKPLDQLVASAFEKELTIVAVLTGGPTYLASSGGSIDRAAFGDRWEKFVGAAVGHYGEMINIWEIGEDINTAYSQAGMLMPTIPGATLQPDPVFYTKLLRSASKIISRADPNDEVWIGSLVSPSAGDCAMNPLTYILEIHGARGWNSADAISYQPAWGSAAPEFNAPGISPACASTVTTNASSMIGDIRSVQELTRQLGGMPVYITSLGWNAGDLAVLAGNRSIQYSQVEADMLARASISLMGADSVPLIFWNTDVTPQTSTANALRNLADALDTAKSIGQVQGMTGSVQEFRFQKGANLKIFLWRTQDGDTGVPVSVVNLHPGSLLAYGIDMVVLNHNTGIPVPVDSSGTAVLGLNERPVLLNAKVGDLADQAQSAITDQLEVWQMQIGGLVRHGLNDAKAAFMDMLEELFNQAKDKAVEWGEEQIDELLN